MFDFGLNNQPIARGQLIEVWATDLRTMAYRTLAEALDYAESNGYRKAQFHHVHDDGVLTYCERGTWFTYPRHLYFRIA